MEDTLLTINPSDDVYKQDLNPSNPLAHNGEVAKAYANLLRMIYDENGQSSFAPRQLKNTIGRYGPAFSGYGQQDSQEFLLFLLDGLQEDLNRIQKKPYIEKPDSTDEMVHNRAALEEFANKCWDIYKARNDSVITDLFAGMYKSTLVCPECKKVSIIFDPFNNLTLQLPIENLWSKEIFYFGLNKKPVIVDIEIDKNASIKALKEMVAKKMGSDPQRLIMCDMYKAKFYKMFDNTSSIADSQISGNDDIVMFEVESVPTNYNPDKPARSYYSFGRSNHEEIPGIDSPKAERLLVPVFNRVVRPSRSGNPKNAQRTLFGVPSYIVISRQENYDYDVIFKKVLERAATMTTRDILNEEPQEANQEDSDTVIMNEDDAQSADSKIKTSSVDGEDGLVDVSMRDASDQSDTQPSQDSKKYSYRKSESSIPSRFRDLFTLKIMKGQNEVVPLGWSGLDDGKEFPKMEFRRKTKPAVELEVSRERPMFYLVPGLILFRSLNLLATRVPPRKLEPMTIRSRRRVTRVAPIVLRRASLVTLESLKCKSFRLCDLAKELSWIGRKKPMTPFSQGTSGILTLSVEPPRGRTSNMCRTRSSPNAASFVRHVERRVSRCTNAWTSSTKRKSSLRTMPGTVLGVRSIAELVRNSSSGRRPTFWSCT